MHGADATGTALTAIYGYSMPRWDNLWGGEDLEVVERKGYGGRIHQKLGSMMNIGFNGVFTDESSRVNASDPLTEGKAYSADWELRPWGGVNLTGESAFSNAEISPSAGAALETDKGAAHRVDAVLGGGPAQLTLGYERVSPDFVSILGSASPDREKVKGQWRQTLGRNLTWRLALLGYRDNLDDQKTGTTKNWKPETTLTVKRFLGRKYGAADLFYRFDRRYGPSTDARDQYGTLGLRDRYGIWDADAQIGMTRYDDPGITKRSEYTYRLGFAGRKSTGNMVRKPAVSGGGWTGHDHVTEADDKTADYALGLGAEWPQKGLTMELRGGQNINNRSVRESDYTRSFSHFLVRLRPVTEALRWLTPYANGYHKNFYCTLHSTGWDCRETRVTAGSSAEFY